MKRHEAGKTESQQESWGKRKCKSYVAWPRGSFLTDPRSIIGGIRGKLINLRWGKAGFSHAWHYRGLEPLANVVYNFEDVTRYFIEKKDTNWKLNTFLQSWGFVKFIICSKTYLPCLKHPSQKFQWANSSFDSCMIHYLEGLLKAAFPLLDACSCSENVSMTSQRSGKHRMSNYDEVKYITLFV